MIDLEQYAGEREYPVVDAGDYEVVFTGTIRPTKDGSSRYLNGDFKIRDDVEQKFKGSHVFEKLFKDKDNPEWFDLNKLGAILSTQKNKEGYRTKFEEVEEFVQYINGACMIVTVEKKWDDYSQKEINEIKYKSYKETKLGAYVDPRNAPAPKDNLEPVADGVQGKNLDKINLPDSELPF